MSNQVEIEDLAAEFGSKPASIVFTYDGASLNGVDGIGTFIVHGFDPVESWAVLQNLAMMQYMDMSEEEQEECDAWFDDEDDDDD